MKTFSTEAGIQKIKLPASGRVEYKDAQVKGLILRVSPRGKTWCAAIRPPGGTHPRRIKIGPHGEGAEAFTLKQARRKAQDWKDAIRAGDDPREEGKTKKAREKDTFETVVERFLKIHGRNIKPNTFTQYTSILKGPDIKSLAAKPVKRVTRQDVIEIIDNIAESGRLIQANRTLAVLRKFFNWCAEKDIIKENEPVPTMRVKPPLAKEKPRSRYLSPEELVVVWRAAEELGWPFGHHLRFLMATGQRQSEAAAIRRRDVDNGKWVQQANKADRLHIVPLSPLAQQILDDAPDIVEIEEPDKPETAGFYFSTTGTTPISGFSKVKRRLDERVAEVCKKEKLKFFKEPWQVHDLRRTMTTHLRKMGFSQETCSKLLNHAPKGVTAVHYDAYDMLPEKTRALLAWGNYLEKLINGKPDNVVELKAGEQS